ncbi:MAG: hypothetical protein WC862_03120 [Patescibacteria group bacterium]
MLFVQSFYLFALALLFAAIEVEIEGRHGWAEKLPTWYRREGVVARMYGVVMGGKPLTGYHAFMFFLPLIIFHLPFVWGMEWSSKQEWRTIAIYFAWCPLWDFLWFILNPAYKLAGFRKDSIWWHSKSYWMFGLFPIDYLTGWTISVVIAAFGNDLDSHIQMLGLFLALTCLTYGWSPLYHRWYKWMRRKDDRTKVNIFHSDQ